MADDAFRQAAEENPALLTQLGKAKFDRDPPGTYLTAANIASHLAKFDDGAVRIILRADYEKYGTLGPNGGFAMSRSDFERIAAESGGNKRIIETRLGLQRDALDGEIIIAKIERGDMPSLRMPSGNEGGADELLWRPGGTTSGGVTEAVVDLTDEKPPFTEVRITASGAVEEVVSGGTGTVFDLIKATQGAIEGTSIPKSFELASEGGKFWVHPNATKHMAEYLTRNGLSHSSSIESQAMLTSFLQAVNQATAQGFKNEEMMNIGRWELIFSEGRSGDALPVIKHALYK